MYIPLAIGAAVAAGGALVFSVAQPNQPDPTPEIITTYVDTDGNPVEAPTGADEALQSDPGFVIEYQTVPDTSVGTYEDDDQYEGEYDDDEYEDDDRYEDDDEYEDDDRYEDDDD
jgi:hypothetical protein